MLYVCFSVFNAKCYMYSIAFSTLRIGDLSEKRKYAPYLPHICLQGFVAVPKVSFFTTHYFLLNFTILVAGCALDEFPLEPVQMYLRLRIPWPQVPMKNDLDMFYKLSQMSWIIPSFYIWWVIDIFCDVVSAIDCWDWSLRNAQSQI